MYGVNLVGVEIVKNYPSPTGGPGGTKPPRPVASKFGELGGQFYGKCPHYNPLSTVEELAT